MNLNAHKGKLTTDTPDYPGLASASYTLSLLTALYILGMAVLEANTGTWSLDQGESVTRSYTE